MPRIKFATSPSFALDQSSMTASVPPAHREAGRPDDAASACDAFLAWPQTACGVSQTTYALTGFRVNSRKRFFRCRDRRRPASVRGRVELSVGGKLGRFAAAGSGARSRVRRPLECRQIEPDQRADRPPVVGANLKHAGPNPGADLLSRRRPARAGRSAGLWLCRRRQEQSVGVDPTDPRLSAGPRRFGPRLCADRRPAWAQRPPTTAILDTLGKAAVSHQIVLTKCDQVSEADLTACVEAMKAALQETAGGFSRDHRHLARTGAGIPELRAAIARLLSERTRPVNTHRSG